MKITASATNININVVNDVGEVVASYSAENYAASFNLVAALRGMNPIVTAITEIIKEIEHVQA